MSFLEEGIKECLQPRWIIYRVIDHLDASGWIARVKS